MTDSVVGTDALSDGVVPYEAAGDRRRYTRASHDGAQVMSAIRKSPAVTGTLVA